MEDADAADGITVEHRSPDAAFALLGDETRVRILQALGETPDEPVPFAELQRRVGMRDSGGFNYHLAKLRGSFVRRTDASERTGGSRGSAGGRSAGGYELTYAGRQVVGAIYAGTYTANATIEALTVEGSCPVCGGDLVAEYAEETAWIDCTACEGWRNEFWFPPGSLDQFDREELPVAFDRWMQRVFDGVLAGFCYTCAGRVEGRLVLDEADEGARAPPPAPSSSAADVGARPGVRGRCPRCCIPRSGGSSSSTGPTY